MAGAGDGTELENDPPRIAFLALWCAWRSSV